MIRSELVEAIYKAHEECKAEKCEYNHDCWKCADAKLADYEKRVKEAPDTVNNLKFRG